MLPPLFGKSLNHKCVSTTLDPLYVYILYIYIYNSAAGRLLTTTTNAGLALLIQPHIYICIIGCACKLLHPRLEIIIFQGAWGSVPNLPKCPSTRREL